MEPIFFDEKALASALGGGVDQNYDQASGEDAQQLYAPLHTCDQSHNCTVPSYGNCGFLTYCPTESCGPGHTCGTPGGWGFNCHCFNSGSY